MTPIRWLMRTKTRLFWNINMSHWPRWRTLELNWDRRRPETRRCFDRIMRTLARPRILKDEWVKCQKADTQDSTDTMRTKVAGCRILAPIGFPMSSCNTGQKLIGIMMCGDYLCKEALVGIMLQFGETRVLTILFGAGSICRRTRQNVAYRLTAKIHVESVHFRVQIWLTSCSIVTNHS